MLIYYLKLSAEHVRKPYENEVLNLTAVDFNRIKTPPFRRTYYFKKTHTHSKTGPAGLSRCLRIISENNYFFRSTFIFYIGLIIIFYFNSLFLDLIFFLINVSHVTSPPSRLMNRGAIVCFKRVLIRTEISKYFTFFFFVCK